jgi:lipopolysaccharide transport system ATP-binding protein
MAVILGIYNETNIKCFETAINSAKALFGKIGERGSLTCRFSEIPLLPGHYYINVGIYPVHWDYVYDYHWQMHSFNIMCREGALSGISGVVSIRPAWSVSMQG